MALCCIMWRYEIHGFCAFFTHFGNLCEICETQRFREALFDSVDQFFQALVAAEWVAYFHSKFHWLVHFAGHLSKLGCLPSCFCHERKHRTVKRFLQAVTNTAAYEKSVLQETVAQDLFDIRKEGIFSCLAIHFAIHLAIHLAIRYPFSYPISQKVIHLAILIANHNYTMAKWLTCGLMLTT